MIVAIPGRAVASPSITVLVASPNPPAPADVVTLTATVSTSPASVLIGFVDFFDNTVPLGTASLLSSGGVNTATLRTNSLALARTISAPGTATRRMARWPPRPAHPTRSQ